MKALKIAALATAAAALAGCASDPYYYSEPRYASSPAYATRGAYTDVGRVVAIDVMRGERGRTTGAGAVVGGIVGGVLGHQIGSGRGNDAATVAGAIGGAVVGNNLERRAEDEFFRVTVELRDGRTASFAMDSLNGLRVGDRVRIEGDRLFRG